MTKILIPAIRKYLIYDNGAGLKDKGISFTRDRLETHLHMHFMETGSNAGWIYLGDYTKFFDNIDHEMLIMMFRPIIGDGMALWLLKQILKQSRVDVSYMSDTEFADSINAVFNSLDYHKIDKSLRTGDKYLEKHMYIGDWTAQVAGVFYPHKLDGYVKIVEGVKGYGRYMDDTYAIHKDKDYLIGLSDRIEAKARDYGIFINKRKTRICKLSDYWRFLQVQYSLTESGRIIKKINPKRLTGMRRKLKKLANILDERDFADYYKSWFKGQYRLMSKKQRKNMDELFYNLKEGYHVSGKAG